MELGKPFDRGSSTLEADPVAQMPAARRFVYVLFGLPFDCLPRWLRYSAGFVLGLAFIVFPALDVLILTTLTLAAWTVFVVIRRPRPSYQEWAEGGERFDVMILILAPPLLVFVKILWLLYFSELPSNTKRSQMGDGALIILLWIVMFGWLFINPSPPAVRTSFGSARLLKNLDGLVNAEGLLIGRAGRELPPHFAGKVLANPDPRHMVTVAANGAGKG
ncbi:MAG: hypothetical protein AAGC81_19645, partial [Pseudomonadota bacterium]